MLILSRRPDSRVYLTVGGMTIEVIYLGQNDEHPSNARLGFIAPREVVIEREEIRAGYAPRRRGPALPGSDPE